MTMPLENLTMGYRRHGSEEQLVNDLEEDEEEEEQEQEMEEAEQEEIEFETEEHPHKHVSFVTDPHMSSWSGKHDDHEITSTKLG